MSPSAPARTLEQHLLRYREIGDPADLGAAFDATAPVLFRMAIAWMHDASAAEDALQETFVAALEHLDEEELDRIIGVLYEATERWFPPLVRIAYPRSGKSA